MHKSQIAFFAIIFCLVSVAVGQDKCQITEMNQKSFGLINCTYVATHYLFFLKIDLLTLEDAVIANYWNSKITKKDSFLSLPVANQFIYAGEGPHKINTNTTLLMPNAIKKEVTGNEYEWHLRLCNYKTDPTGFSGLFAQCDLKFQAKIKIQLKNDFFGKEQFQKQ